MLSLVSRKLGAISFSNCGNGGIDVKSGCSSLVGCTTNTWLASLFYNRRRKVEILTSSKGDKTAGGERVREG